MNGRVFHTCVAATGKERPPMVAQCTRGMIRSAVDSPCQPHDEIRRPDTTVPDYWGTWRPALPAWSLSSRGKPSQCSSRTNGVTWSNLIQPQFSCTGPPGLINSIWHGRSWDSASASANYFRQSLTQFTIGVSRICLVEHSMYGAGLSNHQ